MAIHNEPLPHRQPKPQTLLKKPFSLAPSIFISFSALLIEPQPTAQDDKISRIVQNLNTQHEAVRRNMLGLLQARSKALMRKANEELAELEEESKNDDREERGDEAGKQRRDESKRNKDEMLRRVRVKARAGAKAEDYEIKPGNAEFRHGMSSAALPSCNKDVEMGGTELPLPRTGAQIRAELSVELLDLVTRGVAELEAYDNHTAESTSMYKRAVERRKERLESISTASAQSPVATSAVLSDGGVF